MKKKSLLLRGLALMVGVLIFVYTINSFGGFVVIFSKLVEIRLYFLLVLINSLLWMLLYTEAWFQLFSGLWHKISYLSLLKIKVSGEGVNFMTPLGFLAGDPVRVLLLRRFFGPEARLRSVVIDRVMHSLSAQFFCLGGILLIFTQPIAFPLWLHVVLLAIYGTLCLVLTSLVFCMITGRGFGIFEPLFKLVNLPKRMPRINEALGELRENLEYYKDRRKHPFVICFFLHFAGRVLGALEIMVIFYCYEGHADFVFALILAALTSFFTITFGFIPGAFGIVERLYADFFALYGFRPEVGLSMQLIRRFRSWFWVLVGIVVLDYAEVADFFKRSRKNRRSTPIE